MSPEYRACAWASEISADRKSVIPCQMLLSTWNPFCAVANLNKNGWMSFVNESVCGYFN
jgi:hypothetical protein